MSLIRKHVAVLQAWACLDDVYSRRHCRFTLASEVVCQMIQMPWYQYQYQFHAAVEYPALGCRACYAMATLALTLVDSV